MEVVSGMDLTVIVLSSDEAEGLAEALWRQRRTSFLCEGMLACSFCEPLDRVPSSWFYRGVVDELFEQIGRAPIDLEQVYGRCGSDGDE